MVWGAEMAKTRSDIQDLLVWAYKDQAVDEAPNGLLGPGVALMRWNVSVDGSDGSGDVHPDAYTVHAAVRALSRGQAGLVISCAKVAAVPDWFPGARPVMAALVNGRGDPAKIYDGSRHVVGHRVRCALELGGGEILYGCGIDDLVAARGEYQAWWSALVSLVAFLSGRLDDYDPVGPVASKQPWTENPGSAEKVA